MNDVTDAHTHELTFRGLPMTEPEAVEASGPKNKINALFVDNVKRINKSQIVGNVWSHV